jgi:hypothetical protein
VMFGRRNEQRERAADAWLIIGNQDTHAAFCRTFYASDVGNCGENRNGRLG